MPQTKATAEALARRWLAGEVKPEDFDPSIAEWKKEEAVRQAIREGDLHRLDFVREIERRNAQGKYGYNPAPSTAQDHSDEQWKQKANLPPAQRFRHEVSSEESTREELGETGSDEAGLGQGLV